MNRILGYGEDAFTLWALKHHTTEILKAFQDKTSPSDCLIFYRPSFGRSGGNKSAEFGEFDAILVSLENIYLIESKWDNFSRFQKHEITLSAEQKLRAFSKIHIKIDESLKGISTGTGITLAAIFEKTALGGSALGDRGLPAERVGAEAAERLLGEVNGKGTVDIYAADQLVPYLAILKGRLMVKELSLHTKTNIWLVEQFFDNKFSIEEHNNVWKISY